MARLAGFNGREIMRVAEAFGWTHARTAGDHFIFKAPGVRANVSIPDHRPVSEGTLRDILKTMGVTVDEFLRIARK